MPKIKCTVKKYLFIFIKSTIEVEADTVEEIKELVDGFEYKVG